jgi:hypothetical protein
VTSNDSHISSNSDNSAATSTTTDISSTSGSINSTDTTSSDHTTNSTGLAYFGVANPSNDSNSTNNSNDTMTAKIVALNNTDATKQSSLQTNIPNQYRHLSTILNPLPSKTHHHLALHKRLSHDNIYFTRGPLQLDALATKANMIGHVEVEKIANQTLLGFSGEGYIAKEISSTNDLKRFSLSTWIKPDYTKGSEQFTIVSKQNAFVLGINNGVMPFKAAQFSIFNGIKWVTVQSETRIDDQKWTHLAVTFDGNTSSIYVNGNLESSTQVEGIPSYSSNGLLETIPVQELSSDSSLVVGAYKDSIRGTAYQGFYGLISDLEMYDMTLDHSSITKIFQTNVPNT